MAAGTGNMPAKTGADATKPTAQQAGQPSGVGFGDILSLLSPLYGIMHNQGPFADALGMLTGGATGAVNAAAGQGSGIGALMSPAGAGGMLGFGGLGSLLGGLAPQQAAPALKLQDRVPPEEPLAPKIPDRYMSPGG